MLFYGRNASLVFFISSSAGEHVLSRTYVFIPFALSESSMSGKYLQIVYIRIKVWLGKQEAVGRGNRMTFSLYNCSVTLNR